MKKVTIIFLVTLLALIVIYDMYALLCGGVESTISAVLFVNSKNYPIIPFALGVVCGHLFWTNTIANNKEIASTK